MARVSKVPEKVFLVVASWTWRANKTPSSEKAFHTSIGQARAAKTRLENEFKYRQVDNLTVIIYESNLNWTPHSDTSDSHYQNLLSGLNESVDIGIQ